VTEQEKCVPAQAKDGSDIPRLMEARNLRRVGIILIFAISSATHACLFIFLDSVITLDHGRVYLFLLNMYAYFHILLNLIYFVFLAAELRVVLFNIR
jgi:hypothetical protein